MSGLRQESVNDLEPDRGAKHLLFLIVGLLMGVWCWALSSPPMSTPDEIVHIANIWCAREVDGEICIEKSLNQEGQTVGTFGYSPPRCFWRRASQPAKCADAPDETASFTLLQEGSYYSGGFQNVLHQLILFDGEKSIAVMKMFNASVFACLMVMILVWAPLRVSRSHLLSISVTSSPYSLWLIGSINPSGWAMMGLAALAAGVLWLIESARRYGTDGTARPVSATALVFVFMLSSFLATQARRDSMLMAVAMALAMISVELVGALYKSLTKSLRWSIFVLFPLVVVVALVAAMRDKAIFGFQISTFGQGNPGEPSLSVWFTSWLTHFPAVFLEAYGAYGIGEYEIAIPQLVTVASLLVLGGALAYAAREPSWRQMISAALLGLALLAMLWFSSFELDLYNVSGRYVLPLFPVIIGLFIYYSSATQQLWSPGRSRKVAISMLGVANAIGLYTVVERYSSGSSGGLRVVPVRFDEWWWDFLPIGPNGLVLLGSASWVMFLSAAFQYLDSREQTLDLAQRL